MTNLVFDESKTTVQAILDEKKKADAAVVVLREVWKQKKNDFLKDCDRIDEAISGERLNLQKEVDELNGTIKHLSGQLAAGVSGAERLDKDTKESLRKLIHEATAKRDEAVATLEGLENVQPEYSEELYRAAIEAKNQFIQAVNGDYAVICINLLDVLEQLTKTTKATTEQVKNRISAWGIDREVKQLSDRLEHAAVADPDDVLPDKAEKPAVRVLGVPLESPEQEDVRELKYADNATVTEYVDGKKVVRPMTDQEKERSIVMG